ncbi:3-oxoacyl-[acyl-carrier-protein] reductase FabG-like [Apostichopus japonicus]|uniref:3-oxoacyl-[acyl-carrier-protein] reductase FabG-like n=1 Tax=Stichopus japonicus TaxID=307972 RepID=UPI003AB17A23
MAASGPGYGLEEKVALIVDTCNDIGRQTTESLLSLGCSVAAASFQKEKLQEFSEVCSRKSVSKARLETFSIDRHDDKCLTALIEKVIKSFKEMHILVNITGTSSEDSIENFKIEDLDKQFSENVRTPLLITKRSSAHLVKTKGCIVNVSSIFGYRPFPQTLTYGMAMKTLIHLTSNSANELASHGVRVNAIIPGAMDTGSQDEKDQSNPSFKKFQDYNSKCHPLGRLGSSHDYSQALLFLVSEHASFITGEILTVDGGRHVVDRDV